MPDLPIIGAFLLLTLGILIVPGPDVLYVMARSLGQGKRAGLLSVWGIGAGVLVHTVLAAFGLSRLFLAVPAAYQFVKWAGVLYLLYLAYRVLREKGETVLEGVHRHDTTPRLIGQAFLTNLLNPKAALFFVALLPQFTTLTGEALFGEMLYLGLLVVALSMLVNVAYALLAAHAAQFFREHRNADKLQRWTSAGVLGAIAVIALRTNGPADL